MSCLCNDATELYGPEAETYARDHLHSQETRGDAFEEILACPDTGATWRLDFPGAPSASRGRRGSSAPTDAREKGQTRRV